MTAVTPDIRGLNRLWRMRWSAMGSAAGPAGPEPLVQRILASRGLTDPAASRLFLQPSLGQLHNPSLMPGLDRAAERLLGALAAGEAIAIYGDYDVDGVTATAILYHMLRAIRPGADVRTYVPHRLDEGYGLNSEALVGLAAAGARVIVSVDCGITAVEPARQARAAGADLIITDHHTPPATMEGLPEALAVVHPRRPDSAYPFGELSGAGVAYKLAWRLATMHCRSDRVSDDLRELLLELLAFAALGTIADVVPLAGENRVIARAGLGRIKRSRFAGLRALVEASGLGGDDISADHAGFALGPRLNACGRMGHARDAVELFTTATTERAAQIASELCRQNEDRRKTERRILAGATEEAEARGMTGRDRRAIVLAHEDWHKGVVGIVCSRLVDTFARPTILLQRIGGSCAGSGRSVDGFSLHAALESCAGLLTKFGGHDMAAGLELEASNLERFVKAFTEAANAAIPADRLVTMIGVDCDAALHELTPGAVKALEQLAPFGRGNPSVRVRVPGLRVVGRPEPFGSGARHLGITVSDPQRRGPTMRLVGWGWGPRAAEVPPGSLIDAVVRPKVSTWQGMTRVEPELEDLRGL
jgi:single-stranded-DNA-specific exonuclease